jgi:hypothetical protein
MQVALMYAQLFWLCVIGLLLNILLRNMGGPVRGWGAAAS